MAQNCKLSAEMKRLLQPVVECLDKPVKRTSDSWWDYPGGKACDNVVHMTMRKFGGRYLGQGAFRSAFAFGPKYKCVIKFGHAPRDNQHNLEEARLWRRMPPKLKKRLTPVSDYHKSGAWLTMPRAYHSELSEHVRADIRDKVVKAFEKEGLDIEDQHLGNIGILDGMAVSIDYGMGIRKIPKPGSPGYKEFAHDQNVWDRLMEHWQSREKAIKSGAELARTAFEEGKSKRKNERSVPLPKSTPRAMTAKEWAAAAQRAKRYRESARRGEDDEDYPYDEY